LLGLFFASSRAKLREIAERLGVRRLANLAGCPAR
jgi:ribosomal protein S14